MATGNLRRRSGLTQFTTHWTEERGERVNMGIAIVVPITRLLEILDYSQVRAEREKAQE
jgi:hypothetical protein